jgi:hypothetical protein
MRVQQGTPVLLLVLVCAYSAAGDLRAPQGRNLGSPEGLEFGSIADLEPFATDPAAPSAYYDETHVYTYVDLSRATRGLASLSNSHDLLSLWAASWARHGWKPRLLTRKDVEHDPGYQQFLRVANSTASRVSEARGHVGSKTDATFRLRGITQFYAKAVAGAGVLTDSDVFNYGLTPSDVRTATRGVPEARKLVFVHDMRNCAPSGNLVSGNLVSGHIFRPQGYVDPAARAGSPLVCVKMNNGLTSGSGVAYRRLVDAMLAFQQQSIAQYEHGPGKDNKRIASMTEMRLINLLGPRVTDIISKDALTSEVPPSAVNGLLANGLLAIAPLCVSFNAANGAWRHAKAVHFYGPGISNWVVAMCNKGSGGDDAAHAERVRRWRAMGMCDMKMSRAKFVRFLRDPLA